MLNVLTLPSYDNYFSIWRFPFYSCFPYKRSCNFIGSFFAGILETFFLILLLMRLRPLFKVMLLISLLLSSLVFFSPWLAIGRYFLLCFSTMFFQLSVDTFIWHCFLLKKKEKGKIPSCACLFVPRTELKYNFTSGSACSSQFSRRIVSNILYSCMGLSLYSQMDREKHMILFLSCPNEILLCTRNSSTKYLLGSQFMPSILNR